MLRRLMVCPPIKDPNPIPRLKIPKKIDIVTNLYFHRSPISSLIDKTRTYTAHYTHMDTVLGFLMQSKNSRHFDAERFNLAQLLLKTPFFLSIIYIGDKMKKTIWIATSNAHKVEEFQTMLKDCQVKCLKDLGHKIDIVEDGTTFEENALIKARTLFNELHEPVISDDSGLEVDAMDKKPGVYSARFLGEDTSYDIKNQYIIDQVKGKTRTARYVCVIAYIDEDGKEHVYRGECEGLIHDKMVGTNGFGYDPIFYYPEFKTTLANVSEEKKNSVSHRGVALEKFLKDWSK